MLKIIWNIVKFVFTTVLSIFRPLRRLICRRRKSSESDGSELTSIGTGTLTLDSAAIYSQNGEGKEIEMEPWDAWDVSSQSGPSYKPGQSRLYQDQHLAQHGANMQMNGLDVKTSQGYNNNRKEPQAELQPEINFFEDMTPEVKKQPKILIRKKDTTQLPYATSLSNRLSVMSDVPFSNSELETWVDEANAWDTEEASDDITWQVEEAMKENRRKERMERHEEQQKRRLKKEEQRGVKSGSLVATRLS